MEKTGGERRQKVEPWSKVKMPLKVYRGRKKKRGGGMAIGKNWD